MIYKCEACGGVLVYDPDLGKMKCTQCGQTSERRFHMKLKEVDPDTEEKEDGKRSFDNLWFGLDKDQKWHGEKEIQINPDWLTLFYMKIVYQNSILRQVIVARLK